MDGIIGRGACDVTGGLIVPLGNDCHQTCLGVLAAMSCLTGAGGRISVVGHAQSILGDYRPMRRVGCWSRTSVRRGWRIPSGDCAFEVMCRGEQYTDG